MPVPRSSAGIATPSALFTARCLKRPSAASRSAVAATGSQDGRSRGRPLECRALRSGMPEARQIETPGGPGRAFTYAASGPDPLCDGGPWATGPAVASARPTWCSCADLPERGYRVILIEQPWKVAGRSVRGRGRLDAAWVPILAALGIAGRPAGGHRQRMQRRARRSVGPPPRSGPGVVLSFRCTAGQGGVAGGSRCAGARHTVRVVAGRA